MAWAWQSAITTLTVSRTFTSRNMEKVFSTETMVTARLRMSLKKRAWPRPAGRPAQFGLTTTTTENWIYLSAGLLILTSQSTYSVATSAPENATTAAREVTPLRAAGYFTTTATGLSRTFPWNQESPSQWAKLGVS